MQPPSWGPPPQPGYPQQYGYPGPPQQSGYPQPGPPANDPSANTKGRLFLFLIALGCGFCAFQCGREAVRPRDSAPETVTPAVAITMAEGRWVTVEGNVNPETVYGTKGLLLRGDNYMLQLAGPGPGLVVVTNTKRSPALAGIDGSPRQTARGGAATIPEIGARPQSFTGMLYRPGGQFMQKDDVIELDDEKVSIAKYCRAQGVHCSTPPLVLVTGLKPSSRILPILGTVVAILALLFFVFAALMPPKKDAAAQ